MSIDKITLGFKGIQGITPPEPKPIQEGIEGGKSGKDSFGDMFSKAIGEVDQLQKTADDQIEGLALKKDGVTTHSAMLALEKADVAFQLMNSIRAKIVRAYEDVLRTQI